MIFKILYIYFYIVKFLFRKVLLANNVLLSIDKLVNNDFVIETNRQKNKDSGDLY